MSERTATDPAADGDGSIGSTFVQVAEDARAYAMAQVDLYKAIAAARLNAAKAGLAFGVVAALLAVAALIGLVVGAIMTLATLVGPGWATVIVVVVVLAIAGILGRMAGSRISRAMGDIA